MPLGDGAQANVLQDDDRVARGNFTDQVAEARRQLVTHAPVLARGGEHFGLQAALPLRDVDLLDQGLRRH